MSESNSLATQLDAPVDRLIEASGAPSALACAGESVAWGGVISIVATYGSRIDWPATEIVRGEQRVQGTMASTWEDFQNAMGHLADGVIPVDALVQEFSLEDAAAFEGSIDKSVMKAVMIP